MDVVAPNKKNTLTTRVDLVQTAGIFDALTYAGAILALALVEGGTTSVNGVSRVNRK